MFKEKLLISIVFTLSPLVNAEVLQDPTMPPSYNKSSVMSDVAESSVTSSSGLKVTKIQLSPRSHSAVINSEKVEIGDSIFGALVLKIEPNKVIVDLKGERVELPLIATKFKYKRMPNKVSKK